MSMSFVERVRVDRRNSSASAPLRIHEDEPTEEELECHALAETSNPETGARGLSLESIVERLAK
jgi:hypothetical protein